MNLKLNLDNIHKKFQQFLRNEQLFDCINRKILIQEISILRN
jgi:hypothetical protein